MQCSGKQKSQKTMSIAGETLFYCSAEFPSSIAIRSDKVVEYCMNESAA